MSEKIKLMAFYLPQFHTIPENDEWWGKGFTEWVNVRKAKPRRKGQYQPRVPLNDNYYDLSKRETLEWQAGLAKEYGVYGFCFYHYWFNGKMLLEKPAEMLLDHKDIDLNFCFSWANEPWARTWDGKNRQVLMPQSYGDEKDWEKHFEYLLPFFRDERYIKVDGKPMFLIYRTSSIEQCAEMMECWRRLAVKNGFPGMHFVETLKRWLPEKRELPFDAKVEFEPTGAKDTAQLWRNRFRRAGVKIINGIFRTKIPGNRTITFREEAEKNLKIHSPKGTYPGAFIGWDNTARRDLDATYIEAPTKQEFKDYLLKKIERARSEYKTDFIFVNAWNEWAEGTYLEPDTKHGYEYLEVIKELFGE